MQIQMKEYAYSPYLKHPEQMPDIDPLKPAMRVMLKMITKTHQAETSAYVPPEGVTVRKIQTESSGGGSFEVWVAEPEDCLEKTPAILLLHGGAFYLPLSVSSLALGCVYAEKLKARVFLPEYRLVPSFPAPCALEDCLALRNSLNEHPEQYGIDPERMMIMGESAGGALAAGLCLYLRDQGMKLPKGQILIYPVLDDQTESYLSARMYEDAVWPLNANRHMWDGYLKNAPEQMLKYLVPMRHPDLSGLPETYIEPQEIDILCDEGKAYARRLADADVRTALNVITGGYHCFDSDLTSEYVQKIIDQRMNAAKAMLEL
ncbi:MAG: alpha/beta hydrolase [Erysipelotrichaceae bacterium]|nr:alpha/beta hydrolase [Erysipelotrichaceae bacterium]